MIWAKIKVAALVTAAAVVALPLASQVLSEEGKIHAAPDKPVAGAKSEVDITEAGRRAQSVKVIPLGSNALEIFRKLSQSGLDVSVLHVQVRTPLAARLWPGRKGDRGRPIGYQRVAHHWLFVPVQLRYRLVKGGDLVRAVAKHNGFKLAWYGSGTAAVLYRGTTDERIAQLRRDLASLDASVRAHATWKAGFVEDVRVLPLLLSILEHKDETARLALKGLSRMRLVNAFLVAGKRGLPLLEKALNSPDQAIRAQAIALLERVNRDKIRPWLESALTDWAFWVRRRALALLGQVGTAQDVNYLKNRMRIFDYTERNLAVVAIGRIGGPDAMPFLVEALRNRDLRYSAIKAIGELGGPEGLKTLQSLLNHKDGFVRSRAAMAIARCAQDRALKFLERPILKGSIYERQAVDALSTIGGTEAYSILVKLLERNNKSAAIFALKDFGSEGSWRKLDSLARNLDPRVRIEVAAALGEIGNESSVDLLEVMLGDQDRSVREHALAALRHADGEKAQDLANKDLADEQDHQWADLPREGSVLKPEAIDRVLKRFFLDYRAWHDRPDAMLAAVKSARTELIDRALNHPDLGVRAHAIRVLSVTGHPKALAALRDKVRTDKKGQFRPSLLGEIDGTVGRECLQMAIRHPMKNIRYLAIQALDSMGGSKSLPILAEVANDPIDIHRRKAIDALIRVGGDHALPHLERFIRTENRTTLPHIASSLGKIKHPDAVVLLGRLFQSEDNHLRATVVSSLVRNDGKQVVQLLTQALKDKDEKVRRKAAYGLGIRNTKNEFDILKESLKDPDPVARKTALQGLRHSKSKEAVGQMTGSLRDPEKEVRYEVALLLGSLKCVQGVPVLKEMLQERDPGRRYSAQLALASIPDSQALELLEKELRKMSEDHSGARGNMKRQGILNAIGKTGGNKGLGILQKHLQDPDLYIRISAIRALRALGTNEARKVLEERLNKEGSADLRKIIRRNLKGTFRAESAVKDATVRKQLLQRNPKEDEF